MLADFRETWLPAQDRNDTSERVSWRGPARLPTSARHHAILPISLLPLPVLRPSDVAGVAADNRAPAPLSFFGLNDVHRLEPTEVFDFITPGTAAAVFIDPPQDIGAEHTEEHEILTEQVLWMEPLAKRVARALRPGGVAIALGSGRALTAWDMASAWAGLSLITEMGILWDLVRRPRDTSVVMSRKTEIRRYVKPGLRGVFNPPVGHVPSNMLMGHQVPESERYAPVQRPVELFNYLVSTFTNPGDLVVDPMCGVGSALVAAELTGRSWVGAERYRPWVDVSRRRVVWPELEECRPIYFWMGIDEPPIEILG